MFRMICNTPQSINSRNVKHDLVIFDIVDFGCVREVVLVFTKLWPFKHGASCAHGGGTHVYDGQACHFLRMSRAVFLCSIHLSAKYKLQVSLLFMEQDFMVLFCEAFSPVMFVLVSVQMKYFPMNICCCHVCPTFQAEWISSCHVCPLGSKEL